MECGAAAASTDGEHKGLELHNARSTTRKRKLESKRPKRDSSVGEARIPRTTSDHIPKRRHTESEHAKGGTGKQTIGQHSQVQRKHE